MINLGNKIRELRKANGLTQEQLASALSVTPQAVSKWEMAVGYPDVSILPIIAGYFKVSLDSLFDYNPDEVDEKINAVLIKSRVNARTFEEKEKVLLDGITEYPSGDILKRELLEHYASQICVNKRTELTEKALDIGKKLVCECNDSFIYLAAMNDMASIYIASDRYDDGKRLIESMPYRYHLDIYDRMRCTVMLLRSEDALHKAREWKRWAHQELHMVCESEGRCFFDVGDYENALYSFDEAADLIERFWRRPIPTEYALLQGPHIPRAVAMVCSAACLYKLGKLVECDAKLDEAYHLIRDNCDDDEWNAYGERSMQMYRTAYCNIGLNEYKVCPY